MFWNLVNPGYGPIALNEGVGGNIIRSIFADGTDGFYFNFSELDELFTGSQGPTNVAAAGDNIGLALDDHGWGSRSLATQLAQATELVTNGDFSGGATTSWTARASASLSVVSGALRVTNGAASFGYAFQAVTTVVGRTYRVSATGVSATLAAINIGTSEAGSQYQSDLNISASTYVRYIVATSTTMYIALKIASNTIAAAADFDNISVKLVDGNHGVQATTAAQPKWQAGGLARFDGSDDLLLTPLTTSGASSVSLVAKFTVGASGAIRAVIGGGTGDRLRLSVDASGQLAAGIGGHGEATIFRSGSLVGQTGVGVVTADGSTVKLYWNGVEAYSAAQLATFVTTTPIAVGCYNNTGTPAVFFNSDIFHALAIRKKLSAAEIAAITNLWGTS